uniref:Uncharacterized protein n=1 Tax=viral metagenome TaxID=1070528 RepID=A0A6H1ZE58_9ZZZZ
MLTLFIVIAFLLGVIVGFCIRILWEKHRSEIADWNWGNSYDSHGIY